MQGIRHLPDGELEIMQAVWRSGGAVSRADIERALEGTRRLAPTTILTFLTRLCDKGFLRAAHVGRANCYTPLISERDYRASESRNVLDRLCGGSLRAFAASLCDSGLSPEELAQLRRMLEEGSL